MQTSPWRVTKLPCLSTCFFFMTSRFYGAASMWHVKITPPCRLACASISHPEPAFLCPATRRNRLSSSQKNANFQNARDFNYLANQIFPTIHYAQTDNSLSLGKRTAALGTRSTAWIRSFLVPFFFVVFSPPFFFKIFFFIKRVPVTVFPKKAWCGS